MSLWEAVVLGVVQGLTEFLPVSSTAHLRIVPALLGWDDPGAAFTAVNQCGPLVAVWWYFRRELAAMARGVAAAVRSGRPGGNREAVLAGMIAVATLPIVAAGFLVRSAVETSWRSLYVVAGALVGLALVLAAAELLAAQRQRRGLATRSLEQVGWRDALLIGLAQVLALVPGASRSGVTMAGGMFCHLDRAAAARFSFLLSLPAVLAAGVFELARHGRGLLVSGEQAMVLAASTLASGLVGYLSIVLLISFLKRHSTWWFVAYRLLLGGLLLGLLQAGRLAP